MRSWTGLCAFLACSLSWSLLGADAFLPAALQRPQSAYGSRRGSVQMASRAGRDGWDRQQALSAATIWSVAALGLGPQLFVEKAQAAVGEGGLPEVAEAFNRILKTQRDYAKVAKTIKDREGKLEEQEWQNTQVFLRNAYLVGNDMRRLVRDADNDKRTKGNGIASEYEKVDKEMDRLCKTKDWQAFVANNDQIQTLFRQLTELLSDVPDEL